MTAGMMSGSEPSAFCCSMASVDSASPGSHEETSLSCSSVSPPARGPAAAATTSQKTRMTHLSRRLLTRDANDLPMTIPFGTAVPLVELDGDGPQASEVLAGCHRVGRPRRPELSGGPEGGVRR